MLTSEPTAEMISEWQKLYNENRHKMKPNRKSGLEIDTYFRQKYQYIAINDKDFEVAVTENILLNDFNKLKLKNGESPRIKMYRVDDVYVAIDVISGFFQIESENLTLMSQIYDDLFLFRGLDEMDLENFFLVGQFLRTRCTWRKHRKNPASYTD